MSEDPSIRSAQLSVVNGGGKLAPGAGGALAASGGGEAERRTETRVGRFFHRAHNAVRGHYAVVAGLSVLSAAGLGALAWTLTPPPMYSSGGLVRIEYTGPQGRSAAEQNDWLAMFETFMASQKSLITSRRTIELAMEDPIWAEAPKPADPRAYFAKHLDVEVQPKNRLIHFAVNDRAAQTAAAAVTAIVHGYSELYNTQNANVDKQRLTPLLDQRKNLEARVARLTGDINAKAQPFGTTPLDRQIQDTQNRKSSLEAAINDTQISIVKLGTPSPQPQAAPERRNMVKAEDLSVEQIAAADPVARQYWEDQSRAQREVDRLAKYYGQAHPLMVSAQRTLESAQAHMAKYAEDYRRSRSAAAASEVRADGVAPAKSLDDLKASEATLRKMLGETEAKSAVLADWERMEKSRSALLAELGGVNHEIDIVQRQGTLGGPLTVIDLGNVPLKPSMDWRWAAAGLGGLVGFLIPALGAMMVSLARRRYRFSDEPATDYVTSRAPMLGMLPAVASRGSAPQLRVAAAYAAHHLRILLSSRATTVVKRTFLLTSAGEGDGKTTVTMALAISFAAAKHRTLVIDGDFVGRRLTRGFNAEQQEGLFESMGHGDMDGQWLNAATNLCILPTGKVDPADACVITAENVRLLLEQAIQHFDVVLIDTGSILGSPESAVLAREVDGVIVTIARGQSQGQVRRAMLRLEALGAMVVGTVFNRANLEDFRSSYCTPTSGWDHNGAPEPSAESELQQRVANFGPLVRAVAAAVPADNHHEDSHV